MNPSDMVFAFASFVPVSVCPYANLVYKSVVVECSTGVEDLAKAIEKKSEEMLNKGYKLVTMSMVGTDKAILVFKI